MRYFSNCTGGQCRCLLFLKAWITPLQKKKEQKKHTHTNPLCVCVCVCGLLASSVMVFMFLVPAKLYGFYGELQRIYVLPHPDLFVKSLTWNTLCFSQNTGKEIPRVQPPCASDMERNQNLRVLDDFHVNLDTVEILLYSF